MNLIARASNYVAAMAPAIEGENGSGALFAVAVSLRHGFDLTENEAWPILLNYNSRCSPPWSERELRHKLDNAGKMARHAHPRGWLRGVESPARALRSLPPEPFSVRRETWQEMLARMRARRGQAPASPPVASIAGEMPANPAAVVSAPFPQSPSAAQTADPALDKDLLERLRRAEVIVTLRGAGGRPGYTATQIEACRIALHRDAKFPEVSAMLSRLEAAKGAALTAAKIAGQAGGNISIAAAPAAPRKPGGPVRQYTIKGNRRFVK